MALSKIKTTSIADDAVTSAKIATGGIATVDMTDGSVTSLKIADGAISTADIADSSVTTDKVADSAITTAKVNNGSITPAKLSTGAPSWDGSGIQITSLGGVSNDTRRGVYLSTTDLAGVTGNAGVYLNAPYSGGVSNSSHFRTKRGAGDAYNGTEIASTRDFRILTGSTVEDTNERVRFHSSGGVSIGSTSNVGNLSYLGTGALINGSTPLLSTGTPSFGGVGIGFDGVTNRGIIAGINASTSQIGFYTKSGAGSAPTLRTLIDETGALNQYGKMYLSDGMPYNSIFTGTVTTDGSGNATIGITGWGWAEFGSYRKSHFVMCAMQNLANSQFAHWVGLVYHGSNSTAIHSGVWNASTGSSASLYFNSNSSQGARWFQIAGWSANTQYTYVIRSFTPSSDYVGAWGGI